MPAWTGDDAKWLASFVLVYAALEYGARSLGSDRGQAGVPIAAYVVIATLYIARLCFQPTWGRAIHSLGLRLPARPGVVVAATVATLLLVIPLFACVTSSTLALRPGWLATLVGLFAQAGVAEEGCSAAMCSGPCGAAARSGKRLRSRCCPLSPCT
jgi:hypothetical protein